MRMLILPIRFPSPEVMGQSDVNVWTTWICEETDTMMTQLEWELETEGDPDDPFNGIANGIFKPIQRDFLPLPPPVQTQRRSENLIERKEHSSHSSRNVGQPRSTLVNKRET